MNRLWNKENRTHHPRAVGHMHIWNREKRKERKNGE